MQIYVYQLSFIIKQNKQFVEERKQLIRWRQLQETLNLIWSGSMRRGLNNFNSSHFIYHILITSDAKHMFSHSFKNK